MSKFEGLLFLVLLFYTPYTCQTQSIFGTPLITGSQDPLAMTLAAVKSANINARITQTNITALKTDLKNSATLTLSGINSVVGSVLAEVQVRIQRLGVNNSDDVVNECAIPVSSVKSAAERILMDANSCVSNNIESIERELNDTYSSIESSLAKINSDKLRAEGCVKVEYEKTEVALWSSLLKGYCVYQVKEDILSTIRRELSTRTDPAFLQILYIDGMKRLKSCHDESRISSFIADTDVELKVSTYNKTISHRISKPVCNLNLPTPSGILPCRINIRKHMEYAFKVADEFDIKKKAGRNDEVDTHAIFEIT